MHVPMRFPEKPFRAVSANGVSDFSTGDDRHARWFVISDPVHDDHIFGANGPSLFTETTKVLRPLENFVFHLTNTGRP